MNNLGILSQPFLKVVDSSDDEAKGEFFWRIDFEVRGELGESTIQPVRKKFHSLHSYYHGAKEEACVFLSGSEV